MTKLQLGGWFRLGSARRGQAGGVEKLGLSTLAGIIFVFCTSMFCMAPAIASAAPIFTSLLSFDVTDGAYPKAGLAQATDGNFYGTTFYGGANNSEGTVFKITPGGTLTTLHNFCS